MIKFVRFYRNGWGGENVDVVYYPTKKKSGTVRTYYDIDRALGDRLPKTVRDFVFASTNVSESYDKTFGRFERIFK